METEARLSPVPNLSQGWLDFLRAKAIGKAPDRITDIIQPVMSVYPFLRQEEVQSGVTSNTGTPYTGAAGIVSDIGTFVQVPESQLWLLQSVFFYVYTATSGDQARARPCVYAANTTGVPTTPMRAFPTPLDNAATPSIVYALSWNFDANNPELLYPGQYLGTWCDTNIKSGSGGNGALFNLIYQYTVLRQ